MRIGQVFLTTLMAGLLFVSSASGEDLNGEWEKANESDGIIGYTRPTSKSSVDEIKAIGTVDAPVAVLEAVSRDVEAQTEYMYMCTEASRIDIPGSESTKDSFYFYNKTGLPWPVDDRDVIVKAEYMIDKATGALFFQAQNISTDFKAEDNEVVRMPTAEVKCIATPLGENKTEVLYQVLVDPGGMLPSFLTNMLMKDLAVRTIAAIREVVKKDKYKNAKSIVTTTPWIRQ